MRSNSRVMPQKTNIPVAGKDGRRPEEGIQDFDNMDSGQASHMTAKVTGLRRHGKTLLIGSSHWWQNFLLLLMKRSECLEPPSCPCSHWCGQFGANVCKALAEASNIADKLLDIANTWVSSALLKLALTARKEPRFHQN